MRTYKISCGQKCGKALRELFELKLISRVDYCVGEPVEVNISHPLDVIIFEVEEDWNNCSMG